MFSSEADFRIPREIDAIGNRRPSLRGRLAASVAIIRELCRPEESATLLLIGLGGGDTYTYDAEGNVVTLGATRYFYNALNERARVDQGPSTDGSGSLSRKHGRIPRSRACATAGCVLLPGLNLELLQQLIASVLSTS